MFKRIIATLLVGAAISGSVFVGTVGAQTVQEQINALLAQITSLQSQLQTLQQQAAGNGATTGGGGSSTDTGAVNGGRGDRDTEGRTSSCVTIDKFLYPGHTDTAAVTKLQNFLITRPEALWPANTPASGFYGALTTGAVQRFQAANGIVSSGDPETTGYGIVGSATRAAIQRISCGSSTVNPPSDDRILALAKARDARRISDIKNMQLALELYLDDNESYPASLASMVGTYISNIPVDPSTRGSYYYASLGKEYHIGAMLEVPAFMPDNDSNCDSNDNMPGSCFSSVPLSNGAAFDGSVRNVYDQHVGKPKVVTLQKVTVSSPNGGESYAVGSSISFRWTTRGLGQNPVTQLDIMDTRTPGWIARSLFGAVPAQNHARLVATNGTESTFEYVFVVPANFDDSLPAQYKGIFGGNYYKANVTIVTENQALTISDSSDNFFKLADSVVTPSPVITVTSPNGGGYWYKGESVTVTWRTANVPSDNQMLVRLRSYDNGQEYNLTTTGNDGTETIVLPATTPIGAYTLEVKTAVNGQSYLDASDSYFKVLDKGVDAEVILARYSYDNGEFVRYQTKAGIFWREVLKSPVYTFNFEEYAVTDNSFFIRDRSRNVSIEIPVAGGWSRISTDGTRTWYNLYYVTKVGDPQVSLRVVSPNGGETWVMGSQQRISWTDVGVPVNLYINELPSCTIGICPAVLPRKYTIAEGLSGGTYSWIVGNVLNADTTKLGSFTVEACAVRGTGSNVQCDTSDSYFKIVAPVIGNKAPVISGMSAPSTLGVGQSGTWTVSAYDPEQGQLSYSVTWGDEVVYDANNRAIVSMPPVSQSSTFTHSYSSAGTYQVVLVVKDSAGLTAKTSATVVVTGGVVNPGVVTVSMSFPPAAQTITVGATAFTFAKVKIDATSANEDVRVSSLSLTPVTAIGASYPINCFAYSSGGVRLNSVPVNPNSDSVVQVFSFGSFTVAKSGVEMLDVKCDVPSNLTDNDTFAWTLAGGPGATLVGATSGNSITASTSSSVISSTMTFKFSGSLVVSKDASSPAYKIVAAGQNDVEIGALRFAASNEDVSLKTVALQITNTGRSLSGVLSEVSLWDGATKVGTGIFTGSSVTTKITLNNLVTIPRDSSKVLRLKANLSQIGTSQSGIEGALLKIDYDGDAKADTTGTGSSSGTTIQSSSGSDTAMDGVRIFRGYPTFAKLQLSSGAVTNGSDKSVLRFKVSAIGRDVGIDKFTLSVNASGATVSGVNVHCYTDSSFSNACSGLNVDGQLDNTDKSPDGSTVEIYAENTAGAKNPLQVPMGSTYYFEARATISGATSGAVLSTSILGDSAYPSFSSLMGTEVEVDSDSNDNFIWSPNGETTSTVNHQDWTNAYGVVGLPSSGISEVMTGAVAGAQTYSFAAIQAMLDALAAQVRALQ